MGVLDQVKQLLEAISRAEKAQLLQWFVRDLGEVNRHA